MDVAASMYRSGPLKVRRTMFMSGAVSRLPYTRAGKLLDGVHGSLHGKKVYI